VAANAPHCEEEARVMTNAAASDPRRSSTLAGYCPIESRKRSFPSLFGWGL
jgi:hypothetical protein